MGAIGVGARGGQLAVSKFRCRCGNVLADNTDFLPYKAYLREDEDTQKPIEVMADLLARYYEARQQGPEAEAEVIWQLFRSVGEPESYADYQVNDLAGKPLPTVLYSLMFPFWSNYDRVIYECDRCGRLWFDIGHNHFVSYLPETDTRHVLWSRHNHNPYGYLDEDE
jgi:hypothetical protein